VEGSEKGNKRTGALMPTQILDRITQNMGMYFSFRTNNLNGLDERNIIHFPPTFKPLQIFLKISFHTPWSLEDASDATDAAASEAEAVSSPNVLLGVGLGGTTLLITGSAVWAEIAANQT